jgi:DNA-binding response OmpR family regulator
MKSATRLLIVEDEVALGKTLQRGLTEAGYLVDHASSAEDAGPRLASAHYHLMVLDLGLPGQDGLVFLRELRRQGTLLPVVILTARDETEELIAGLETGADDYVTKPFAFRELLARIRALLRRPLSADGPVLAAGEITIDTSRRRSWRGRRELDLSPKELMILECLTRHAGLAVTRDMIGESVWGADYKALSNIVDVFINHLRQKIDLVGQPSLIVTIRGEGYLLRVDSTNQKEPGPV